MRLDDLTTYDGWWRVDSDGNVHVHESVVEALRAGICLFTRCQLGDTAMAVFLKDSPPAEVQAKLVANRPDWLDAILHVRVVSKPDDVIARIAVEIGFGDSPAEACAAAAACVAQGAGTFKVEPERYAVQVAGHGVVRVTMAFDWDTERWSADAVLEPGQGPG